MTAATPYLKLPLAFDAQRMQHELAALPASAWIPHYNRRDDGAGWRCVPLRSVGGRADHIFALEGAGYADTPWLDRCPYLREVIARFRCEKTSIRLMALDAGSVVPEHRDAGTALESGITRVHVPIATTPQALMKIEGEPVHFAAGHAWYLNAACLHGVENGGPSARVHLMIDCETNDWVREVFRSAGGVWQPPLTADERALLRGTPVRFEAGQEMRGWYPVTFSVGAAGRPEVGWRHLGDRPLTAAFFQDTFAAQPAAERRVCETPLDALDSFADSVEPSAFVFHVSRCGSTLLTQMLSRLDSCIALSEPPVLDAFFRFHHRDPAASGGTRTFRALVAALAQRRTGRERHCVVKLDSWHVAWAPWLREAFPRTPFVLLYRDPAEVLASHRRQRGRHMVPGMADLSRLNVDAEGLSPGDLDGYAERVIDAIFSGAVEMARDAATHLVDYPQLPGAVLDDLTPRWGIACTDDEREAARQRARFHSKHAESRFEGDAVEDGSPHAAPRALESYARLDALRRSRDQLRDGKMPSSAIT